MNRKSRILLGWVIANVVAWSLIWWLWNDGTSQKSLWGIAFDHTQEWSDVLRIALPRVLVLAFCVSLIQGLILFMMHRPDWRAWTIASLVGHILGAMFGLVAFETLLLVPGFWFVTADGLFHIGLIAGGTEAIFGLPQANLRTRLLLTFGSATAWWAASVPAYLLFPYIPTQLTFGLAIGLFTGLLYAIVISEGTKDPNSELIAATQ